MAEKTIGWRFDPRTPVGRSPAEILAGYSRPDDDQRFTWIPLEVSIDKLRLLAEVKGFSVTSVSADGSEPNDRILVLHKTGSEPIRHRDRNVCLIILGGLTSKEGTVYVFSLEFPDFQDNLFGEGSVG